MNKLIPILFCLAASMPTFAQTTSSAAGAGNPPAAAEANGQVVFVCEHGSAKSMIAATYFNTLAQQKGLKYRAVSRGINVDDALQPATAAGLSKDGMDTKGLTPSKLTPELSSSAARVVTMGLASDVPYLKSANRVEWAGVPAISKDYGVARDDIVARVKALMQNLEAESK